MGALSYQTIQYKMPRRFSDLSPYNVKALHHKNTDAKYRVMFLFDHITTGDLNNRKILSDIFGIQFFEICNLAADFYKAKYSEKDLDWLAVPFNQFKTYGKDNSDLKAEADASFAQHVSKTINDYKPDVVVIFGPNPLNHLCSNQLKRVKGVYTHLIGTSFDNTFTYKNREHTCKVVPSISMNTIFNVKNPQGMYLAGYVARNLVTAFDGGKMRYAIPTLYDMKKGKYVPRYKTHYLTTVKDVEKCIKKMRKAKFVSIDTEAQSLLRVYNKIQTIQFCCSAEEAYIIPIYHTDSPFSGKELKRITSLIRDYFEDNENTVQIYANGKFDLSLMRSNFDIRYYCAKVWDVQAGEFALDENNKLVANATGSGYYALGNLAVQYGCYGYLDNPFGKENRAFIADNPLSEPVLQYCALDVLVPWLIFKSQQRRAKDIKYDKYRLVVSQLIGDQQHAFSTLESSGALCDIDYLFYLKTPDSPVNQIIRDKEKAIYSLPAVKKVNELISRDRGVPQKGLLGKVALNHFSLSKTEHKQILFFDVLKLKPLNESEKLRANGKKTGKIDKDFKKKYEDHPAVAALNELEKAQKIRNSYVDSFINMFGSNKDFKKTRRMRPNYSYRDVVTGRTSASDPNLQQIPSRGPLSKYIKRLFIAAPKKIMIKVDYSAHEVRGWSIISGEKGVADVFQQGADLRNRYRLVPDPYIKYRIDKEGDVHKINAAYFFGIPIRKVTKKIRDGVKAVIFGLIYQQGDKGLAKSTGRDEKEIHTIKGQFLDRFPVGLKWFDIIKNHAKKHYFVESPLGRRRTLWPLMFARHFEAANDNSLRPFVGAIARCLRQAVNSPVQGFGSDFMMTAIRLMTGYMYDWYKEHGEYPDMSLNVSVHDSLTVEVDYKWFWLAINFIERAMTWGCKDFVEETYKFPVLSTPEIDFDIGGAESNVKKWDFSYAEMSKLLDATFKFQKEELNYKIDEKKMKQHIMEEQYHLMPEWMQKQLWANDIKIKRMGTNPLSKEDRASIDQYKGEFKANAKMLKAAEKQDAEDEARDARLKEEAKAAAQRNKMRKAA